MKSVSFPDGVSGLSPGGIVPGPLSGAAWEQSRLPTWSSSALHRGDDLPGVPLDCFTASMMDDGSDPAWVPYEHNGCDPVFSEPCLRCESQTCVCSRSESPSGSEEEPEEMEVDQD